MVVLHGVLLAADEFSGVQARA